MKEIAAALFKFQQEVGKVKKDATNPFFKSKYATLSNVLDVIREPLNKCNLVVTQSPFGGDEPTLSTKIIHAESGEYILSDYPLMLVKNDPQSMGSAITYARRYALVSMLCLDVDDDDDGNAATKAVQPTQSEQQAFREQIQGSRPKIAPAKIITEGPVRQEQLKLISFYLKKLNRLDVAILVDYSVSELKDLTSKQAVEVINNLEKE